MHELSAQRYQRMLIQPRSSRADAVISVWLVEKIKFSISLTNPRSQFAEYIYMLVRSIVPGDALTDMRAQCDITTTRLSQDEIPFLFADFCIAFTVTPMYYLMFHYQANTARLFIQI